VSPNSSFPRQWTVLPTGSYDVERPVVGLYGTNAASGAGEGGQSVLLAPGHVTWGPGRWGTRIQISYINGWPHTSLTTAAAIGASTLAVDDCTGWAITSETGTAGATGTVYDSGQQEVIQVTSASVTSGPGNLTLAAPATFAHAAGTLVSALPESIMWAVMMFAASMALTRGATTTTVQTVPGAAAAGGGKGAMDLVSAGENLLKPFRRVI
jgi:hypothetical protein